MKITFICKEYFGPLNQSPALFSLSQVRCFWHCLWFRMNCSSIPEDVCPWWPLMHWHHSVHSFWSFSKFLKLLFLAILSRLWSFRLLVDVLIPHFPLLVNFLLISASTQHSAARLCHLCQLDNCQVSRFPMTVAECDRVHSTTTV